MKKRNRKKESNESGQAIIEFIVVFMIIFTMLFMFVQMAWSIAYGHYAHYATFMASRAYFSASLTRSDQMEAASSVLRSMLKTPSGGDLFPFVAKARGGDERDTQGPEPVTGGFVGTHPEAQGKDTSRVYSWAEGVQYNFGVSIFLLPLASFVVKEGQGQSISAGNAQNPTKAVEWRGAMPFTSDSFLGREVSVDECYQQLERLSRNTGISRGDSANFLEDNGC